MSIGEPTTTRSDDFLLSFVLPVYNEVDAIDLLIEGVRQAAAASGGRHEIVFVNDGSTDGSAEKLTEYARTDLRIRVVHFSRNFGHQPAVQAGLAHADGDAVIVMDSDLQDDPKSVAAMVKKWQEGFDVVFAIRTKRKESMLKRALFYGFYRMLNAVSTVPIPNDAGNFGLIDRQVAQTILQIPDSDRFYAGLRNWAGFRQTGIQVERQARHDDQPRVSWYQLFQLAKSAIFSFSRAPLSLFYAISILSLIVCMGCFAFTIYHKTMTGLAIPGWASGIMTASFFGALNALGIGVLGEYVVRIYDQVRGRPQYVVARVLNQRTGESLGLSTSDIKVLEELDGIVRDAFVRSRPLAEDECTEPLGSEPVESAEMMTDDEFLLEELDGLRR